MSKRKEGTAYHPDRGDLIHLQPAAGHELTSPQFALVISTARFSKATGFCIILPATTKYHHDQKLMKTSIMVQFPASPGLDQTGWVYTHQVKSVDCRERNATFVSRIEDLDFLIDMMDRVRAFIDPDSAT